MDETVTTREKVRKIQDVIYCIICDIDDFCTENSIRYYLSGGTCIGAIRHHGFIPWDDDGDIMMPREDYERFVKEFSDTFKEKYGVGDLSIDSEWQRPYARVWDKKTVLKSTNLNDKEIGVFVDIFPIDGVPESYILRKLHYSHIWILRMLNVLSIKKGYLPTERFVWIKKIVKLFLNESMNRSLIEKTEKCAKKYSFEKSSLVGVSVVVHYGDHETISHDCMSEGVKVLFRDRNLPVPIGYDTYLTNLYGDYMKIPKGAEEKGYSHLDHWDIEFLD